MGHSRKARELNLRNTTAGAGAVTVHVTWATRISCLSEDDGAGSDHLSIGGFHVGYQKRGFDDISATRL